MAKRGAAGTSLEVTCKNYREIYDAVTGIGANYHPEATSARIPCGNSESATLADLLSATVEPDLGVDLADLFPRNEVKRGNGDARVLTIGRKRAGRGDERRRLSRICDGRRILVDAVHLSLIIVVIVVVLIVIVVCRRR